MISFIGITKFPISHPKFLIPLILCSRKYAFIIKFLISSILLQTCSMPEYVFRFNSCLAIL